MKKIGANHTTAPASSTHSTAPTRARTREDANALRAVMLFPALIFCAGLWGFLFPHTAGHITPYTSILLGVIMFGMGLTLTVPDFRVVFTRPLPILIGVAAQYLIMPSLAVFVVWLLQLPPDAAVGVILVGCAPGGTASNVVAYLAKADVALSVTMTSVSTIIAPIFTPLLTAWLAGKYMPVSAGAMAISIAQMVLAPVIGGLVVRLIFPKLVDRLLPALPWLSTIVIAIVVAGVVAPSHEAVRTAGVLVFAAVAVHNLLGFAIGFGFAKLLRSSGRVARTVSIEVGMQNSGMAATLANQYFPGTAAALPGGIFSIWHNLSGAVLALIFRRLAERESTKLAEQKSAK
ncbi:MAG: bile acid:sodium symporter family protein [Arcanobacterium sp.]|nr:bile acid:sodium symporter family protein [Arcanobacterium sp.]